ncbi:MAG: hypothetical protein QM714_02825 [Nocardioides sp.]|uniref:hypothetical protein n=1 Tax=Nocardioides sp. TaxID=35761 RepID=UPI0039E6AB34
MSDDGHWQNADGTCPEATWPQPERGVPRTYIATLPIPGEVPFGLDLLITVHPDEADGIEVAPRLDETRWGAPLPVRRAD